MIYLTGVTNPWVERHAFERGIGLMIQPKHPCVGKLDKFPYWAADNGAFTRCPGGFNEGRFRRMLVRPELEDNAGSCLFVVAPDVLEILQNGSVVGDARATVESFASWSRLIRDAGYPVALVAQDGLETMLDEVPWDIVDVLFIGGSDQWKLSAEARACIAEARRHGKPSHMGRVNSFKRLARAQAMLCDTVDGTFLRFGEKESQLERIRKFFVKLSNGVQTAMPWGR